MQTRRIHILPESVANQIAAGEVVERPASVAKELIENSLDAAATRIEIEIRNGGKTEIRVADDGCGMIREDALLALDRHATSKIRTEADLYAIRTLGFRGEALPSIAAVSVLELETAVAGEPTGTRVRVNGGRVVSVEEVARQPGTTVVVRNLFLNVPARAKFLKSAMAEARATSDVVVNLALSHPAVAFSLRSNGRAVLDLRRAPDLATRIADIWGAELAGSLIPVDQRTARTRVAGLVQRPAAARPGLRRVYLFINGRPFADRFVLAAAEEAYRTTIPAGHRPALFLYLDVPVSDVDVNVHPAKAEVRFRDRGAVESALREAVLEALGSMEAAATLGAGGPGGPGRPP
ncbi:MAG: DNA mismatch repair endonuclease MutL, partial [Gemmatimonadetes bacterium]|nr:DNA mismatch repair endonuclease MutL [Gemmatimonadota bacterium]